MARVEMDKKDLRKSENKGISKFLVIFLFLLIIVYFSLTLYEQEKEMANLTQIQGELEDIYKERERELKRLKEEYKNIDSDAFIEKQAREKLKMVKQNEVVYVDTNKVENKNKDS